SEVSGNGRTHHRLNQLHLGLSRRDLSTNPREKIPTRLSKHAARVARGEIQEANLLDMGIRVRSSTSIQAEFGNGLDNTHGLTIDNMRLRSQRARKPTAPKP